MGDVLFHFLSGLGELLGRLRFELVDSGRERVQRPFPLSVAPHQVVDPFFCRGRARPDDGRHGGVHRNYRVDTDLLIEGSWGRAISFHHESTNVADTKLAELLPRQTEDIQRRIASVYGSRYDLEQASPAVAAWQSSSRRTSASG